ncbi:hypothetical protein, partial [Mycobacterium sp. 1165178.9]|uniref:hypothetical protein n=1 Tax=Mycobacterium sp. 1165178.9 TaxID=1834070 RepID=UPI001E384EC4
MKIKQLIAGSLIAGSLGVAAAGIRTPAAVAPGGTVRPGAAVRAVRPAAGGLFYPYRRRGSDTGRGVAGCGWIN